MSIYKAKSFTELNMKFDWLLDISVNLYRKSIIWPVLVERNFFLEDSI